VKIYNLEEDIIKLQQRKDKDLNPYRLVKYKKIKFTSSTRMIKIRKNRIVFQLNNRIINKLLQK